MAVMFTWSGIVTADLHFFLISILQGKLISGGKISCCVVLLSGLPAGDLRHE